MHTTLCTAANPAGLWEDAEGVVLGDGQQVRAGRVEERTVDAAAVLERRQACLLAQADLAQVPHLCQHGAVQASCAGLLSACRWTDHASHLCHRHRAPFPNTQPRKRSVTTHKKSGREIGGGSNSKGKRGKYSKESQRRNKTPYEETLFEKMLNNNAQIDVMTSEKKIPSSLILNFNFNQQRPACIQTFIRGKWSLHLCNP